MIFSLI